MTGIILMIFGTLTFVVGIVLYGSPKEPLSIESDKNKVSELEKAIEMAIADGVLTSNEKDLIKKIAVENGHDYNLVITDVEKRLTGLTSDSETQIIDPNEKNGYDFEKFIVQKFNKKYYRVKEWAGDKYVKGVYAETTTQPDILMKLQLSSSEAEFSIECKWRQRLYKGGVQLATESQLSRYKDFEKDRGIPVFVAIGKLEKVHVQKRYSLFR